MRELFTMWRSTRMVVLTSISAALYAASLVAFKPLSILPGVTEIRPGTAFVVLCSLTFGPAGAWGAAIGNTIGDLAGGLGPGTAVGFLANLLMGLLPYKLYRAWGTDDATPSSRGRVALFFAAGVVASAACAITVGVGIQGLGLWPIAYKVLANAIFVTNTAVCWLLGTFLLLAVAGRVTGLALRWQDILDVPPPPRPSTARGALRRVSAVLAVALTLAGFVLGELVAFGKLEGVRLEAAAGVPLLLATLLLAFDRTTQDPVPAMVADASGAPPSEGREGDAGSRAGPGVSGSEALRLEGVRFRYRGGTADALAGVTLSLEAGRMLAVLGPVGAGKTTLARIVAGIVPDLLKGRLEGAVRGVSRDASAIVFEDFESQLFTTETTLEVAFGPESRGLPRAEIAARLEGALARVGLTGFAGRSPSALSGGEKQRLAIAAALALDPRVLVLDEPTTDLDPVAKADVLRILRELRAEGRTIVLVEHETEELGAADRAVLLEGGKVVREGPARDLLAAGDLLRAHGVRPPEIPLLFARLGLDAREAPIDDDAAAAEALRGASVRVKAGAVDRLGSGAGRAIPGDVVLSAREVRHTYEGRARPALDGVSLEVRKGEMLAILGANGSGKSTLARALNGLLRPDAGSIAGSDPRAVGFVFQNPDHQIFSATVEEEVAFGPRNLGLSPSEVRARVTRALETVGLAGDERRDPFALPRSDRQRLAVASVLAMETPVLILDEPTTGLDHEDQCRMMQLLQDLRQRGHTIIVITHHIWIALEHADRVVLMAEGRKVFDGPVREAVLAADALAAARVRLPPVVRLGARLGIPARGLEEVAASLEREGARP